MTVAFAVTPKRRRNDALDPVKQGQAVKAAALLKMLDKSGKPITSGAYNALATKVALGSAKPVRLRQKNYPGKPIKQTHSVSTGSAVTWLGNTSTVTTSPITWTSATVGTATVTMTTNAPSTAGATYTQALQQAQAYQAQLAHRHAYTQQQQNALLQLMQSQATQPYVNQAAMLQSLGMGGQANAIAAAQTPPIHSGLCPPAPGVPNPYDQFPVGAWADDQLPPNIILHGKYTVRRGSLFELVLPDGTVLRVDSDGSYKLGHGKAKTMYRGAVRDFNKFLNASDLLEEFIRYVGALGLSKDEFMNLPIDLFIAFLIVRAAETDGEEPPKAEIIMLEDARKRLRQSAKTPVESAQLEMAV